MISDPDDSFDRPGSPAGSSSVMAASLIHPKLIDSLTDDLETLQPQGVAAPPWAAARRAARRDPSVPLEWPQARAITWLKPRGRVTAVRGSRIPGWKAVKRISSAGLWQRAVLGSTKSPLQFSPSRFPTGADVSSGHRARQPDQFGGAAPMSRIRWLASPEGLCTREHSQHKSAGFLSGPLTRSTSKARGGPAPILRKLAALGAPRTGVVGGGYREICSGAMAVGQLAGMARWRAGPSIARRVRQARFGIPVSPKPVHWNFFSA